MEKYKIVLSEERTKSSLKEASKEELAFLIALISRAGAVESLDSICEIANISLARASSALHFWLAVGVISPSENSHGDGDGVQTHTVPEGRPIEEGGKKVARDIRDRQLSGLIGEVATLMDRPMLSTAEAAKITNLYTQYSLSDEYIITLAAYLKEKGKLTVTRLEAEALKFFRMGIDCVEEFERYLMEKEKETEACRIVRSITGIFNRKFSSTESKYAEKWVMEFGFSEPILTYAYDLTVQGSRSGFNFKYMDTILTDWHTNGLKTVEECEQYNTETAEKIKAERAQNAENTTPQKSKKSKPKPRYGDFDIDEAFNNALQRSYGEEDDDD